MGRTQLLRTLMNIRNRSTVRSLIVPPTAEPNLIQKCSAVVKNLLVPENLKAMGSKYYPSYQTLPERLAAVEPMIGRIVCNFYKDGELATSVCGSCSVIHPMGLILTCDHVVTHETEKGFTKEIKVYLHGDPTVYLGDIAARCDILDVALIILHTDPDHPPFPYVTIVDESELKIGDKMYFKSYPFFTNEYTPDGVMCNPPQVTLSGMTGCKYTTVSHTYFGQKLKNVCLYLVQYCTVDVDGSPGTSGGVFFIEKNQSMVAVSMMTHLLKGHLKIPGLPNITGDFQHGSTHAICMSNVMPLLKKLDIKLPLLDDKLPAESQELKIWG